MATAWYDRIHALTTELVRCQSVTNTPGELECARLIHRLLSAQGYFRQHPADLRIESTLNDPCERSNIFALVRGHGSQTVILSGHFDVVSLATYGPLAPWACDPEQLMPRLIQDLDRNGASATDRLALDDLQSGLYMPGRGALDMKSGIAMAIAILEKFAEQPDRRGNLLLVATPDEEDNSNGMRSASMRLPALVREWGLDPVAAINLDATNDRGDGSDGRAVFLGSVGKLLPAVYLVGRETHAGRPFDGVNPNLLAAEVTRRIECSADLVDLAEGEATPAPVSLKQTDLKEFYDVTTPSAAWCTYNLLTHSWSPGEVLGKFKAIVLEALNAAMDHLRTEASKYGAKAGTPAPQLPWEPRVLTFDELQTLALTRGGAAAAKALQHTVATLKDDQAVDDRRFSLRLIEALWPFTGLSGPAAVVCFASLYYPRVHVSQAGDRGQRLQAAAERHAAALAAETGFSIRVRPFFPGISDMSFLGCADSKDDLAQLAANTPAWGTRIRFDYEAIQPLRIPVINAGPWGRDYHQRTERVQMPYSFGVVPELVWRIAEDLLK